ncbi:MAG TPA: serine/threonine-protein kinase [Rudaea sp.]
MSSPRWGLLERFFADALALPVSERDAFLRRVCANDDALRAEIESLLSAHVPKGVLDTAPVAVGEPPPASIAAGTLLGPWRIEKLIGRGGMGEVYRARRADGTSDQTAAVKVLRDEAAAEMARFHSERHILAHLEHPGIARLLDGGTTGDSRPYTVMEYVGGEPLTAYCAARNATLHQRLALMTQVCDAVSFAHRNLVIHRDLKPDNILVGADGGVKLLDFGIAKLLDAAAPPREADVTIAPFTPDYASPEQLSGQPVTTATDVYALGVLLFELLCGERPLRMRRLPSTHALKLLMDRDAPLCSRVAYANSSSPVPPKQLAGDLDAIVAKCLRKEPAHRYETVDALKRDLQAHLDHMPVLAREGARLYVAGRLLRRYRWAFAATVALIVSLSAGLAGTIWQARRANVQAARATATKDFMLGIFHANDPRVASDKPRSQITARELLDIGSARIEKDFSSEPELQIELLGLTADIYENLQDEDRYSALQKRRIELARAHYGPEHPIVLEGLITEAEAMTYRHDFSGAARRLDEVDHALDASSRNESVTRARWWLVKWELLHADGGSEAAMNDAVDRSIALYRRLAPTSNDYAYILGLKAMNVGRADDFVQQRNYFEQALAVLEVAPDRSDSDLLVLLTNYARNLEQLGDAATAEKTYIRSEDLARRTRGERSPHFWLARAYHARLLHRQGDREHSHALFAQMLEAIPADWKSTNDDAWARGEYADCLVAEGRAAEAVPVLEATVRRYTERTQGSGLPAWRMDLGDAYDRAGRIDAARSTLKSVTDEIVRSADVDPRKSEMFRERWARFLLDHPRAGNDVGEAATQLRTVIKLAGAQASVELALAHAGLARIATGEGDATVALAESTSALQILAEVKALYDVRLQPRLWLVHSSALRVNGDAVAARQWADKALQASRRYDDPSSSAIADAESSMRRAELAARTPTPN